MMTFLRQTVLWLVVVALVIFTSLVLFDPGSIAQRLDQIRPPARLLIILALDAGLLAYVYLRIRQPVPVNEQTGLMVKASGAITRVDIDSARDRVLKAINSLPDIGSATAQVQALHGKADIQLDVVVAGDAINVPNKQKEINRALQQVINKQLGLQMAGRPRIHIQIREPGAPVERPVTTIEEPPAGPPAEKTSLAEPEAKPLMQFEQEPVAVIGIPEPVLPEAEEPEPDEEQGGGLLASLFGGQKESEQHGEPEAKPADSPAPESNLTGEGESAAGDLSDEDKPSEKPPSEG